MSSKVSVTAATVVATLVGMLLDTTAIDRVLHLDRDRGLVEVEAGIQWPALVAEL